MSNSNDSDSQSNVASFMKSSYYVGSIVNVSFGGSAAELQRVVSPSHCEFNYVSLDPELDQFAEEFEATQSMVCIDVPTASCMFTRQIRKIEKF